MLTPDFLQTVHIPAWTGSHMGIGTSDFSYNFSGKIDEVRIVADALPAAEIAADYQAQEY